MECQSSDSKKLFKVFDASKRKRTRKKREGLDDSNSIATDDSTSGCQATVMRVSSAKASLQDIPTAQTVAVTGDNVDSKRDRDSSPSVSRSPGRGDTRHSCRSPRRHRRSTRDGVSLALKAGLVSTPRSTSPHQEADGAIAIDSIPQDQDSFIYAFLEEAIKRDKKRQRERHSRRHEDRRISHEHERDVSGHREHRHRHRRRHDHDASRERDRPKKEEAVAPAVDQAVLFETFAKICSQLNAKSTAYANPVPRTLSHKSLQCEVVSRRDSYDVDHHPVRLRSHEHSRENVCKTRSQDNCHGRVYSHERIPANPRADKDKCNCCYEKDVAKYSSKLNMTRSKMRNVDDDRYPDYPPENPRNHLDHGYRSRAPDNRDYRDYDRDFAKEKHYENDKRRYYDQKTSRSFEVSRDGYPEDEKYCRRTARSDNNKEKHYDERDKYYEEKHMDPRDRYLPSKDRRVKRNLDRFERTSVASRDDDYRDRDRDRYSERERDSGLSVADGENSTVSGKSNYLRVVKQEIAEQREAMDKMMKLWKELMRCFKGMSTQGQTKSVHESAANAQESAAAQLRLWRECMRRYETVARDVGDTDARLMEEINKQRSEMAEMASMWQECLQRYREMSSDFNSLKQQVTITKQQFVPPESPTRIPAAPITCAEGEGSVPPAPYRLPPNYPQMPGGMPHLPAGYPGGGSPLRPRASAPPAWWWCGEGARDTPRRRSSPDSRGSRDRDRDRDRRHRHKDRDDSRYKEKSSKPSAARSEHRHRKR